eukprot:scaffold6485_cov116-Skeletonema_dohrnii-CCMP3373.AAC.3
MERTNKNEPTAVSSVAKSQRTQPTKQLPLYSRSGHHLDPPHSKSCGRLRVSKAAFDFSVVAVALMVTLVEYARFHIGCVGNINIKRGGMRSLRKGAVDLDDDNDDF